MIPFSVLDLCPVPEGATPADALRNTLDLARHAEAMRRWHAAREELIAQAHAETA